jgi:hypothetical protein
MQYLQITNPAFYHYPNAPIISDCSGWLSNPLDSIAERCKYPAATAVFIAYTTV